MSSSAESIKKQGFAVTEEKRHPTSALFKPRQKLVPKLPAKYIALAAPFEAFSDLRFMQFGTVRDTWLLEGYHIEGNRISSPFTRRYHSSLMASPSHVVPTTFAVVVQHLAFIYGSELFGFDHSREERLKLWPTEYTNIQRNLIPDEENLVVELTIDSLQHYRANMYMAEARASVNNDATMTMKCVVYTI